MDCKMHITNHNIASQISFLGAATFSNRSNLSWKVCGFYFFQLHAMWHFAFSVISEKQRNAHARQGRYCSIHQVITCRWCLQPSYLRNSGCEVRIPHFQGHLEHPMTPQLKSLAWQIFVCIFSPSLTTLIMFLVFCSHNWQFLART